MTTPTHGKFLGKSDDDLKLLAAIESSLWGPAFARPCYCRDEAIHLLGDIVPFIFHAPRIVPA